MTTFVSGVGGTLIAQFYDFPGGGALVDLDALPTITITDLYTAAVVVGPTTVGVTHPAVGTYTYPTAAPWDPAQFSVVWNGLSGGDPVQASEILTVSASQLCDVPVDTSCIPEWAAFTPTQKANGIAWATYVLWALTGRRFGACEITVRPCYRRCEWRSYETYGVWTESPYGGGRSWVPFLDSGEWRNCGCCGVCCCGASCEVWLPGPVASIVEVRIDNAVVDPATYRVDNGELLVRQNTSACWPQCANLDVDPSSVDNTFVVTYTRGEPWPKAAELAAGKLAGEFARACAGEACGIPERVRSVSRGGVNFELVSPTDEFENGLTGFTEVDLFIKTVNPNKLMARPWVSSIDMPEPRRQTWP